MIATTIWNQISMSTKMACGARKPIGDDKNRQLMFQVGGRTFRKIVVTLTPADLYDVKLIKIKRNTIEAITEESHEGIFADQLSEIIYHMVNK
jgi:hypothetical protein